MSSTLTQNVPRPNYNTTVGAPVKVVTNHYKVQKLPTAIIQQWAVSFPSDKSDPKSKAALMRKNMHLWSLPEVQSEFGNTVVIYNGGGIAYTCQPLPFENKDKLLDKTRNLRFRMSKTTTINPETLQQLLKKKYAYDENVAQVITFLDALLSASPRQNFSTVFGTSQFFKSKNDPKSIQDKNVFDLGGGVQLWRGIFQSARPGPGYMTINVDVAHSAFYQPDISIIDLLVANLQLAGAPALTKIGQNPRMKRAVVKLLQGLGVYTSHTKRREQGSSRPEKIYSVLWNQSAISYKFEKDGKMLTVAQYLKDTYNITLKHPALPLLEMNGGKSRLPMELCKVASGQKFPNALLTGQQTSEVVKQAARPPAERLASIKDNVKSLNWAADSALNQFGLQAATEPVETTSRVLDSPVVVYGKGQTIQPKDGKWKPSGKQFFNSTTIESWGILKLCNPREDTSQFEREIVSSGLRCGIRFAAKAPLIDKGNPDGDLRAIIQGFLVAMRRYFDKRPQIVFIILPKGDYYGPIKYACDSQLGIVSQCIAANNLRKANAQYCENVWLKANAKLGGINSRLAKNPFAVSTLLLGADVSHPPAGALAGNSPSIASLVSNVDAEATRYIGQASSQPARQEVISNLLNMVENALRVRKDKILQIIYYRDGVGENQFEEIRQKELPLIKQACQRQNVPAKITVVICQKRHHTRFFPKGPGNVRPGTVVDSDITHPIDFDFFLVPHFSFKGTARPTHYQVIYDENRFKAEALQKLTHDMCYAYARSTTAVSFLPVAYYAHLVGNRVKAYCQGGSDIGSDVAIGETDPSKLLPGLNANLRQEMWYI